MSPALQIAVIADDITGAADTGGQFCPAVGPVCLANAIKRDLTAAAIRTAGMAVFTNTRHMDAAAAAQIVRLAAEKICSLKPRIIYKKIDSCLRGNLGAEIDALLEVIGATASFVAPAFPQQGRTTINDCHLIHGIPVAETEIGYDPLCPVRESRLSARLTAQTRMPVGHVDLASIEDSPARLMQRVRTLLNRGCRHIAFDAEKTIHLDAIAGLARDHFENILLVGSAGLASSLSRMMAGQLPSPAIIRDRPGIKKWLFVCGSASWVLADQVARLASATGWAHVVLDPVALAAGDNSVRQQLVARISDARVAGSLILSIQPIRESGPIANPDLVVQGLSQVAAELLPAVVPDGVFLSGGDTVEAFWHRIGASALIIREEILSGLMRGEFVGGPRNGLSLVTKAGAFGHADTLNQLINSLK